MDDDELCRRTGIHPRQSINYLCRRMHVGGLIARGPGPDGKIVNSLPNRAPVSPPVADLEPPENGHVNSLAPGSSLVQRQTESVILRILSERLGVDLAARRVTDPVSGARVDIDGASPDLSILVECWAHQGPAKVAQKSKLVNDATKLYWIAGVLDPSPHRLILCVTDEAAVRHLRGRSWHGAAIAAMGVEIEVVDLPPEVTKKVIDAQRRQYR